ncbi:24138_t:CDS:2, partial [Gigaspora margarita]
LTARSLHSSYNLMTKMGFWSGVWKVAKFVGKVAGADVVAKGYAISQLAKESRIRIFKKGGFVAGALDVVAELIKLENMTRLLTETEDIYNLIFGKDREAIVKARLELARGLITEEKRRSLEAHVHKKNHVNAILKTALNTIGDRFRKHIWNTCSEILNDWKKRQKITKKEKRKRNSQAGNKETRKRRKEMEVTLGPSHQASTATQTK